MMNAIQSLTAAATIEVAMLSTRVYLALEINSNMEAMLFSRRTSQDSGFIILPMDFMVNIK
jgi:hypothetical protein